MADLNTRHWQHLDPTVGLTMWRPSERGITLARIFNLREGLSRFDDVLPERFFAPTPEGPLKDSPIDAGAYAKARKVYYQMLGWDEKGASWISWVPPWPAARQG